MNIYDNPWAYEFARAHENADEQVDALLYLAERHGSPVTSVLELAAGPAAHARSFARRGIAATALDLNEKMCTYARERARAEGVELCVVQGDMSAFALARKFDLVIAMLDGPSNLATLDAMVAKLDRVAAHLGPGGLYILDMAHPKWLAESQHYRTYWDFEYGDVSGSICWGEADDPFDPITQVMDCSVTITVTRQEHTQTFTGVVPYRYWTATELDAALRLSGKFQVVAQYGEFTVPPDPDVSINHPEAGRMITVLALGARETSV